MGIIIKKEGLNQLKRLEQALENTGLGVKAGILGGAQNLETGQPIAPYAMANEFGNSRVPARPFMRNTVDSCAQAWMAALAQKVPACLNGREGKDALLKALGELGVIMAEDIRSTIRDGVSPANAEHTRKQKGGKPALVKSGALLGAIRYEVMP